MNSTTSTNVRIDAHQHYWTIQRSDYGWLKPEMTLLYQDFQPRDLEPLLARHGIAKTIVIQAAPSIEETDYLLDLATQHASIAGVIGWVDMLSSKAPETIARLAQHPKFRGIRPMLQDLPQDHWISAGKHQAPFDAAVEQLLEHDLVFEALVYTRHLDYLHVFAQRHPKLRIIIDHGAKPEIANATWTPWADKIAILAKLPNVACKLSGLITEAGPRWSVDSLRPYVNHLMRHFGTNRLIWGSDWPILTTDTIYPKWLSASEMLLKDLNELERDAVFGDNANLFYRLNL